MKEKVIAFLAALGIEEADGLLTYCIESVGREILEETGTEVIPRRLEQGAVYRAAGEYLWLKKSAGQLREIDLSAAEKEIKEGDTTIAFAYGTGSKTTEERLEDLIKFLLSYGREAISGYRRVKW